jgi:hypothetical protein
MASEALKYSAGIPKVNLPKERLDYSLTNLDNSEPLKESELIVSKIMIPLQVSRGNSS